MYEFFQYLISPRGISLVLAIGALALSLALVVLMATRWGKVHVLSKCVALSVLAHMLLLGYAHVTEFVVYGNRSGQEVLLSFTDDPAFAQASPRAQQAWDKPPPTEITEPVSESLPKAGGEATLPSRGLAVPDPTANPGLPTDANIQDASPVVIDVQRPRVADASRPVATAVEAPPAERQENPLPDAVPVANPERIAMTAPPLISPRRQVNDQATVDVGAGSRLQRLQELLSTDAADSIFDRNERTASAKNLGPGQQERFDPRLPSQSPVAAAPVPAAANSNSRAADGAPLPGVYGNRGRRGKGLGDRLGATAETEAAVSEALVWLSRNQSADGRWKAAAFGAGRELKVDGQDRGGAGSDADNAVTALAVLAFLADGENHLEGEHREQVQHGLEYLIRSQGSDGNLSGGARMFAMMYCHGMSTLAISEAYAVTGDPRLKPFVEKAVKYSIAAQHPTSGGWRYQPGDEGDMSQFGWQVMALRSAELAGIPIPASTKTGMQRFLKSVSSGTHGGLAAYRAGDRPSPSMTAEALACRMFLDYDHAPATVDEAAKYLLQETPDRPGQPNEYYWYYASLGLHQLQDSRWDRWNSAMQRRLIDSQVTQGADAGSWDTNTVWGGYGGRVYTTSMAALCLEVYYRYTPLHGKPAAKK